MFNEQLMKALMEKYGQAKALMPMIPGAGTTHAIAGSLLDKLTGPTADDGYNHASGMSPDPTGAVPPTPAMPPVAPSPVKSAQLPPVSTTPTRPQMPAATPQPTAPAQPQLGSQYNDAARQQLYADMKSRMQRGAGFQALGGLADTISRAGGSQPTTYSENIGKQTTDANKLAGDQFEAGRKGQIEDVSTNLAMKKAGREETEYQDDNNPNSQKSKVSVALALKMKMPGIVQGQSSYADVIKLMPMQEHMLIAEQNALARAAAKKEALEGKHDKMIARHAENLSKAQTPQLLNAFNELAPQFESGQNVKGIGGLDSWMPGWTLSDQGKGNRERLSQLANVFLKLRSGAAVTDPEYRRFLNESQAGSMPTEAATRRWLKNMKSDLDLSMGLEESSLPPELLAEYKTRPGAVKREDIYGSKPASKPLSGGWKVVR